jgi:cation transport ATPase
MGTALRVANDVGIDKTAVWAGISPQGKTELIQQMQQHGDIVAMVSPLCTPLCPSVPL